MVEPEPARRTAGDIWAVTVYFNPMGYARRRDNYRVFREHLALPLVTVELAYTADFDLGGPDAEILLQVRGRDVLWQKERLMNVALGRIPSEARKLVFIDCDVVFESPDWVERMSDRLDGVPLVQPFSHLNRMPPGWVVSEGRDAATEVLRTPSSLLDDGMSLSACFGTPAEQLKCSTGSAWGVRRDCLDAHGFYDACVIGGGDSAFVRAAYGRFDDAMRLQHMNAPRRDHYLAWARPFHDAVRAETASIDGHLLHLWHGRPEDRRYRNRNEGLEPFEFNPYVDVAVEADGAWRWNSDKPAMHGYVRGYFASRREDG